MTKYGYARTSSVDQNYGLQDQVAKLESKGCVTIFSEQVSAKDMDNRTEWNKLLEVVVAGDEIIVTTLSRLARTMKDTAEIVETLKKKKVGLNILDMQIDTSTAGGAMMFNVLAAFNTYEADVMRERQKIGIALAKEKDKTLPLEERAYKGRKPTAQAKTAEVLDLHSKGLSAQTIANATKLGVASIYRIMKANK